MQQIHPDASLVPLLNRLVAADLHYHLYTNNWTPTKTTVLGDLTEQAGGDGYAPITVVAGDFTLTGVTGHRGYTAAGEIGFEVDPGGGPWTIYGYFVTDDTDTDLLAVGRFDDAPRTINAGEFCNVGPIFGDSSLYP